MNFAANRWLTRLLALMGELEGRISGSIHYDNVAPCFLGGLQFDAGRERHYQPTGANFDDWLWVMAYPGIKVSTAKRGRFYQREYRRQDCIAHDATWPVSSMPAIPVNRNWRRS